MFPLFCINSLKSGPPGMCELRLATVPVFSSHLWLLTAILDSAALDYSVLTLWVSAYSLPPLRSLFYPHASGEGPLLPLSINNPDLHV